MIESTALAAGTVHDEPYRWVRVTDLFGAHAGAMAAEFPTDAYRSVRGRDEEKAWFYLSKSLYRLDGSDRCEGLTVRWSTFVRGLASVSTRRLLGALTGVDLGEATLEVNALVFPPGGDLGAHTDLPDKLVSFVMYFNSYEQAPAGGNFLVLGSHDEKDVWDQVEPHVGNAVVIRRSHNSWHAVQPVRQTSEWPRLGVTATYYQPNAISTMWPDGVVADELAHAVIAMQRDQRR